MRCNTAAPSSDCHFNCTCGDTETASLPKLTLFDDDKYHHGDQGPFTGRGQYVEDCSPPEGAVDTYVCDLVDGVPHGKCTINRLGEIFRLTESAEFGR